MVHFPRWKRLALGVACMLLLTMSLPMTTLPRTAFAQQEAISITPTQGPPGTNVTVTGTGWNEHGSRGMDVPIQISASGYPPTQVADPVPDTNGNFTASFAVPANVPAGQLTISAIIGNGGSAQAWFTVTSTAPTVTVQQAFTRDGNGTAKNTFASGDAIQYAELVNNANSGSVSATFNVQATDPNGSVIFSSQWNITIPAGVAGVYTPSTVPTNATAGAYTFTVTVTYNGQSSKGTGQFTVIASTTPTPKPTPTPTLTPTPIPSLTPTETPTLTPGTTPTTPPTEIPTLSPTSQPKTPSVPVQISTYCPTQTPIPLPPFKPRDIVKGTVMFSTTDPNGVDFERNENEHLIISDTIGGQSFPIIVTGTGIIQDLPPFVLSTSKDQIQFCIQRGTTSNDDPDEKAIVTIKSIMTPPLPPSSQVVRLTISFKIFGQKFTVVDMTAEQSEKLELATEYADCYARRDTIACANAFLSVVQQRTGGLFSELVRLTKVLGNGILCVYLGEFSACASLTQEILRELFFGPPPIKP